MKQQYNIEIWEDSHWVEIFRTPFTHKSDADIALRNCVRHHPEGIYQIVETWA